MKALKRFNKLLKHTGMHKMFMGFIAAYFIASFVLFLVEPAVHSYGEGLWFCFVSFSTIGFGDYTSVTMIGRITIIMNRLRFFGLMILAIAHAAG